MATASGLTIRPNGSVLAAWLCGACAWAAGAWADDRPLPLDPLARAVVDAVAHPPPTTPRELLAAAARTAEVDADLAALGYFRQLVEKLEQAGDARGDLLADLGDTAEPGALQRLERLLGDREPAALPVVQAIREASSLRRRDPRELARAIEGLRSDSSATRAAATMHLGRAGIGALPVLVELLQTDDDAGGRARGIARELVRALGTDGRQALVAWLGSGDLPHWPGVIAALEAGGIDGTAEYLLAPAAVPGTPPAIRDRALAALGQTPSPGMAATLIAHRLDAVLTPAALPQVDCLLPPNRDADRAQQREPTVDRFVWNPQAGLPERRAVSPRAARAQEAVHLARDLAAVGATEPHAVRLVILARLESMLAFAEDSAAVLHDLAPDQLLAACTGPDGVDVEAIADVLDMAIVRGMFEPAAAVARALEYAVLPIGADGSAAPASLPPPVRKALVRALEVPDATLQWSAARTLALAGGDPPYPGSSRVIEVLRHAATSTGADRVIVAHPDMAIVNSLATGVSRFGYQTVRVTTGRAAVIAAREHRDTMLVMLSARLNRPSAFETTQFIQQQPYGDIPPILVVVDPLDDDPRGCFLTNLILKFSGLECVAIVDRLDSFFQPTVDAGSGTVTAPARFPDALVQLAGPRAVDTAARARRAAIRLDQSRQAAVLLGILSRRCWDIPETTLASLEFAAARPGTAGYNRPAFTPHPSAPTDAAIPESTR